MELSSLPACVLDVICSFMSGFDAFYLSHVNSYWFHHFSDDMFWQKRVLGYQDSILEAPWKQDYIQSRSLLFQSSPLVPQWQEDDPTTRSFAWLQRVLTLTSKQTRQFDLCTWLKRSFSFDTWFFLLPGTEDR